MEDDCLPKKATKYKFPLEEIRLKADHEGCPC